MLVFVVFLSPFYLTIETFYLLPFQVIFSISQTYELMHGLEEIRLSFRSHDYLGHSGKGLAGERSERTGRESLGKKTSKTARVSNNPRSLRT